MPDALPLFNASWYVERNPDVVSAGLDPWQHYLSSGWSEGRWPNPLFDPTHYLDQNPDVSAAGYEPLAHYVEFGWKEGRRPHPLFDPEWYLDQNPDVKAAGIEPLAHYLEFGWREGRAPSVWFDIKMYVSGHADVDAAGIEPLGHYLHHGWREGRHPNSVFLPLWYASIYGDTGSMEPLSHYVRVGASQFRKPNPYFDPLWYAKSNTDACKHAQNAVFSYLDKGLREGRIFIPDFDAAWYMRNNPDVVDSEMAAVEHFMKFGDRERRQPSEMFDPVWYEREYKEPMSAYGGPFEHYVAVGRSNGFFQSELHKRAARASVRRDLDFKTSKADPSRGVIVRNAVVDVLTRELGGEPFLIVLGGVGFDVAAGSNGYVRRVRSIDAALGPLRRVYVRVVPEAGRPAVFASVSENVFELTVNETPIEQEMLFQIAEKALGIYSHSIYPLEHKTLQKIFAEANISILDLHGIVPEETTYSGLRSRADVLYDLERSVIGAATHVVSVTRRMKNYFIDKYPGIDESKFINIPIMISSPRYPVVRERSLLTEGALYAGSLDSWQNIDVMLKAVEASGMRTDILTADAAGFWNAFGHLAQPIKEKLTVKSVFSEDELWDLYQKSQFGFAIRSQSEVNQVACPTKLIEYCAAGIIPVLLSNDIGDFPSLGLQFIPLDMFSDGNIPSRVVRVEMMSENALVFLKLRAEFFSGIRDLISVIC
ncbi:hypothetical protein [Methylobacterium sp. SD21]|uniref:hypothetical protein n=1 Tax=Methylobacterium litchii TaxID=3138810 RepID=UPI00313CB4A0